MKRIAMAGLVVFGISVALESSAAPGAEDAIKQAFVQIDRCVANKDAKCIGELLADDATFSEPTTEAKVIKGKAKIVDTLKGLMGEKTNDKGAKPTHIVENIRMVGTDHAIVDSSVKFAGMEGPDAPQHKLHTLAVMALEGDRWLFLDLRNYIVGPSSSTGKNESNPPAKNDSAPSAKESAPTAKETAPPAEE